MNICEDFLQNIKESKLSGWNAELISTFSNFESEKLYGNSYDFGDFDKCINFVSNGEENFQGKYCSVQYYSKSLDTIPVMPRLSFFNQDWVHLDTRFGGAVCIPSICDPNTFVPKLMEVVLNNTNYAMSTDYNQDDFCQVKKNFKLTASGIFGISFVLFFLILAIIGTIKSWSNKETILASFSLTRNIKNLVHDENSDEKIKYLRGIKAISQYIITLVHIIMASLYFPTKNPKNVLEYHQAEYELVVSQGAAGSTLCQMITSFLVTQALWKMLEHKRMNIPMLYIYRYLRMVPLIFFVMVVERFIVQGWISEIIGAPYFFPNQFPRIYKYFWLPVLQIQNYFIDIKETFLPPSYYFAVDFHLFLITPFVVYVIWKWPRSSVVVFSSLLAVAFAINYSYIMENKEYFENMKYLSYEDKILSKYIQETQYSFPAWIFGMIFGYLTIKVQSVNRAILLDKKKKYILWITPFLLTFIWTMRTKVSFIKNYGVYLSVFDKFYHGLIFMSVLFLCHYGCRDIITKILSLRIWVPFDRVGLSVLISHAAIFRLIVILQKEPIDFSLTSIIRNHYLFGMLVTMPCALILNLLIEQPIINLFKFYYRASNQKKKNL